MPGRRDDPHRSTDPHTPDDRRWCGYGIGAAASLAVTVVAGVWLRVAQLQPAALGGLDFRHAVHAHSHVALFGWTTMALFALVARAAGPSPAWARWHARAVGAATAAAFVGFLLAGYTAATIAIATLHVALWVAFAAGIWRPLRAAPPTTRRYAHAALVLLLVAGAGAMTPGIVRARGLGGPWLAQLSVELFLAPFIAGWLGLGVAGAIYGVLERPRFGKPVLWLLALGALPSALFRVTAPPPAEWLSAVGRVGTLGVGLGVTLLALDVLAARRPAPFLRVAGVAALLEGIAEIVVAAGGGLGLVGSHHLAVAYLHLVLLGVVTPALMATVVLPEQRSAPLALLHAAGLLATLAALVVLGVPTLAMTAAAHGLTGRAALGVALAGGVASAAAVLLSLAHGWRARRSPAPVPASYGGERAARVSA